jgi:hypothetical protein
MVAEDDLLKANEMALMSEVRGRDMGLGGVVRWFERDRELGG